MQTMTVTEIIPIVATKLNYRFLLQIQQILQQHEDGICYALVLCNFHISCRHKVRYVPHCIRVYCNRMC